MDLRATHYGADAPITPQAVILVKKKAHNWEVSTYGKLYVFLVLLEVLSLITIGVLSLVYAHSHIDDDSDVNSIRYTSIVAIVAALALLYFSLDSILLENIFQFWTSQCMHILITSYVIWHYLGNGDDLGEMYDRASLYVMISVCAFQLAYLILAWPVQKSFGWRLYKKIGGNVAIRPVYRTAAIFFSLLKLDFALGLILVLLAIFYLLTNADQIILNVFASVITLGWLILGFQFVQRESRRLGAVFFTFATLEPAYIIYKLIAMKLNNEVGSSTLDDAGYPVFSWNEFLLTGCLAVLVRFGCIIYGVLCMRNFGLGLRDKLWGSSDTASSGIGVVHQHTPQHAQVDYNMLGQPVVVVRASSPSEKPSALRNYIQPLL